MALGGGGLEGLTSGGTGVVDSPLLLQAFGTAAAPELAFVGNTGSGLFSPALNQLGLAAGNQELLRLVEGVQEQVIVSPGALFGTEALPSLAFGDGDTGFHEGIDDRLHVSVGGTANFLWQGDEFRAASTRSAQMRNVTASGIVPAFSFQSDNDTGIGSNALDQVSIIAGGAEIARAVEDGAGNNQFIILQTGNNPALPSLAWGDGDSGFFEQPDDTLGISLAGVQQWFLAGGLIGSLNGSGAGIRNETASATNPTVNARRSDDNTGLGSAAADQLDLIAGGLSCMSVRETAAARQIGFYTTAPISLQTGVAVTEIAIHAALVALGLITA